MFALPILKKKVSIYYAQSQTNKNYDGALHQVAVKGSSDFCKRVVLGTFYIQQQNRKSVAQMFRELRVIGILTNRTTLNRLKNGTYTHVNTLILSYFAEYLKTDIVTLYNLGDEILDGKKELKHYKVEMY